MIKNICIFFYCIFAFSILFSIFGCGNKDIARTSEHFVYDNSVYTLTNERITVTSIGKAPTRNNAKMNALTNLKQIALDTLSSIVYQIATFRHLTLNAPLQFQAPALRQINYEFTPEGEMFTFSCTATISLAAVSASLYDNIKNPGDYGKNQFLRDLDSLLSSYPQMSKEQFRNEIEQIFNEK